MKTPFRVKTVEEQVDALAQAPEQLFHSSASARLIRDLYQAYDHSAYTRQLERSLEHVEQRLQRSEALNRKSETKKQQSGQRQRNTLVYQPRRLDRYSAPRRSFSSFMASLAAVLLSALLVGSLVLTLRAIHHGGNPTSIGGSPAPTTISVHLGSVFFQQSSVTISQGMSILLINDANVVHPLANGYWDAQGKPHPLREAGMPAVSIEFETIRQTGKIGPFNEVGRYHLYDTIHVYANLLITVLPFGSPVVNSNSLAPAHAITIYLGAQAFETQALRPGTITLHRGMRLLLVNDSNTEHVITNGRWQGNQLKRFEQPGMPVVHIDFHAGVSAQLIGPFSVAGTYYLVDTVHVGMNLQIIVE